MSERTWSGDYEALRTPIPRNHYDAVIFQGRWKSFLKLNELFHELFGLSKILHLPDVHVVQPYKSGRELATLPLDDADEDHIIQSAAAKEERMGRVLSIIHECRHGVEVEAYNYGRQFSRKLSGNVFLLVPDEHLLAAAVEIVETKALLRRQSNNIIPIAFGMPNLKQVLTEGLTPLLDVNAVVSDGTRRLSWQERPAIADKSGNKLG